MNSAKIIPWIQLLLKWAILHGLIIFFSYIIVNHLAKTEIKTDTTPATKKEGMVVPINTSCSNTATAVECPTKTSPCYQFGAVTINKCECCGDAVDSEQNGYQKTYICQKSSTPISPDYNKVNGCWMSGALVKDSSTCCSGNGEITSTSNGSDGYMYRCNPEKTKSIM